jgi:hypothetical protein
MTTTEFLAAYPQFASGVSLVPKALEYAATRIDEAVFGDSYELALGLLAADWLCTSPYAQSLQGSDDPTKPTRYRVQFEQIRRERVLKVFVT